MNVQENPIYNSKSAFNSNAGSRNNLVEQFYKTLKPTDPETMNNLMNYTIASNNNLNQTFTEDDNNDLNYYSD